MINSIKQVYAKSTFQSKLAFALFAAYAIFSGFSELASNNTSYWLIVSKALGPLLLAMAIVLIQESDLKRDTEKNNAKNNEMFIALNKSINDLKNEIENDKQANKERFHHLISQVEEINSIDFFSLENGLQQAVAEKLDETNSETIDNVESIFSEVANQLKLEIIKDLKDEIRSLSEHKTAPESDNINVTQEIKI